MIASRGANESVSRVLTIEKWLQERGAKATLNIGSGGTTWGSIRLDRQHTNRVTVRGDAAHLPFADSAFRGATLTDVLEHLPAGSEKEVLREIRRVLYPGGWLLITAPNKSRHMEWFDPAWWLLGHRHLSLTELEEMVESAGFSTEFVGSTGTALREIPLVWMVYAVAFTNRMVGREVFHVPQTPADEISPDSRGYTAFLVASKERGR